MTEGRRFPDDISEDVSPTSETFLFGSGGKLKANVLAALFTQPGSGLASVDGISSGALLPPTELTTHGEIPADAWLTVIRGDGLYTGLTEQTGPATTRLLYLTGGSSLVPYGWPSSTQSINGAPAGDIVGFPDPGLYVLIGDGINGWAVLRATPAPIKDDLSGSSGIPNSSYDAAAGWSNGSRIIATDENLYICVNASAGTWKVAT